MPAYHAENCVVRGKCCRMVKTTLLATSASKPKRIITNAARILKISALTQPPGSALASTVKNNTQAIAAAHCLRNKTRKTNKTNRSANQKKGANINVWATSATIARAPRKTHSCGPVDGCGGG